MPEPFDLSELDGFAGGDEVYRTPHLICYTEGIRILAERAGAYWLIDAIGSYQRTQRVRQDVKLNEFQLWELRVKPDKSAVLTLRRDSGERPVVRQIIEYTDFPADIKLYVSNRTLMLPSEY